MSDLSLLSVPPRLFLWVFVVVLDSPEFAQIQWSLTFDLWKHPLVALFSGSMSRGNYSCSYFILVKDLITIQLNDYLNNKKKKMVVRVNIKVKA